ncbi:hypothetical protein OHT57_02190 [Streptomyces sp. NBC_00285]|nr:hypothetical protein [Streptomyces sp. NBC_00285]
MISDEELASLVTTPCLGSDGLGERSSGVVASHAGNIREGYGSSG